MKVLQLDPKMYSEAAYRIMEQRGLIQAGETIENVLTGAIEAISRIDRRLAKESNEDFQEMLTGLIGEGVIVFGTPLLQNIRSVNTSAAACTVIKPKAADLMDQNSALFKLSSLIFEDATGIGFDLSDTEDPVQMLLRLNELLNEVNSRLLVAKKRPVASMATLRSDHPQILEFIRSKRYEDFKDWRINISVFVSEQLFNTAKNDGSWALCDEQGTVTGNIPANEILREIADSAHYCGEPGILFKDRLDAGNPTPQWGYISTAPCAELAMAEGEACHFSYINLGKLVTAGRFDTIKFQQAAACLTRLLDAVTECTVDNRGDILWLVREKRRIGAGITGFADLLIKLGLHYGSPESITLSHEIAELLDFYTKKASVDLARTRGAFPSFTSSRYTDRSWLERKLDAQPAHNIPRSDWDELHEDILRYGIRNASTTALPPTGTSSEIVGISKSLEPYFSASNGHGELYEIFAEQFGSARIDLAGDISPDAHMRIQAGFQSFIDDGISKTVNMHNAANVEQVYDLLWAAYHYNLKGITVFRDHCLEEREVHAL